MEVTSLVKPATDVIAMLIVTALTLIVMAATSMTPIIWAVVMVDHVVMEVVTIMIESKVRYSASQTNVTRNALKKKIRKWPRMLTTT